MMSQQPPHILIADDERSIRLMLETGLTLNGFRVTCARNGREALELAKAEKFDAVLSDIYMPDWAAWNWWTRCARPTPICRSC